VISAVTGRVWIATAALCAGTLIGTHPGIRGAALLSLLLGSLLLRVRRRAAVTIAAVILISTGAGMLNADIRLGPQGPLSVLARDVPRCDFEGTVLEQIGGLGTLLTIDRANCPGWAGEHLGVVTIDDGGIASGALFRAQGWLVPLSSDGFDMARARVGAQAALHPTSFDVVRAPRFAHGAAAAVREGVRDAVGDIDPAVGALLSGLTIGDTEGMSPVTVDSFRAAGLSHVLAVSGSNVAIVLAAALGAARSLGHRTRMSIGFAALGLFVLVVGPDASVLRAGATGAITLACLTRGNRAEPLSALGLAVMAVVAVRPGMLFSVGMHLSVAATAGIVLFCRPIEARLSFIPPVPRLMLAATLAAQAGVLPVLMLVFGNIPLSAPVANALALPAVGVATVGGLAAGCLALVWDVGARVLARVVAPVGSWILLVARHAGAIEGAVVSVPRWWGWVTLLALGVWAVHVLRGPAR
jgi:ComEC/Rec2-related protein